MRTAIRILGFKFMVVQNTHFRANCDEFLRSLQIPSEQGAAAHKPVQANVILKRQPREAIPN